MRKPRGPCEGCKDRRAEIPELNQQDCHKSCGKYKEFKQAVEKYHKELHERIKADMIARYRPWRHRGRKYADKNRTDIDPD